MRDARRGSDDTLRSSPRSRRRARSPPMRRWRSRATAHASGSRSTSSRRATGRCCCYGILDYRTTRSPRRRDWRAARSGQRYRGRAGGWCKPTRRERQVSMSHVDDGTLHAYLDGELSPAEAQGIDAHLAQCPACRGRLEEERALITRAGELLALAAPPDRELPPFRAAEPVVVAGAPTTGVGGDGRAGARDRDLRRLGVPGVDGTPRCGTAGVPIAGFRRDGHAREPNARTVPCRAAGEARR